MNNDTKGILFASVTALLWGFLAVVLKIALNTLDPVSVVWFRFTIAFVFLFLWILVQKPSYLSIFKKPPWLLILISFSLGVNYLGFIKGIDLTSPSTAQVFMQIGPVMLALSGIIIYKEKITRLQVLGLIMVLSGMVVFFSQQIKKMPIGEETFIKGVAWIFLGALTWTIYAVIQKKLVKSYPTIQLNLLLYGIPALLYLPAVDYPSLPNLSLVNWLVILFLGLNTLIAYICIAQALKYTQANKVSVIITMNPIITFIVMGFLTRLQVGFIAPEYFTVTGIAGALLVLSGAILTIAFSKRERVKKAQS